MANGMSGKTALVTGGGSGIGRAAVLAFAKAGARVAVVDRDATEGRGTVAAVEAVSGSAIFLEADVSRADDVQRMVQATVETYGSLDFAFNNAGVQGEICPTADCTEENWDLITGINLKGVFLCMKYEIAHMLDAKGGVIVNNASNFGLVGSNGMPAYSASKHGVVGLTKTAALEYAQAGIRINAVCPGPVHTPLVDRIVTRQPEILDAITDREPIGRMGQPDEIAHAVLWLCSPEASFVVGAALSVDGGYVAQ